MAGIIFKVRSLKTDCDDEIFDKNILEPKKRHKKLVLRPYLQISFDTDFKALFNGIIFWCIQFVKWKQSVQKVNFRFLRFILCYTRKQRIKNVPLDRPFNFIMTLLELS